MINFSINIGFLLTTRNPNNYNYKKTNNSKLKPRHIITVNVINRITNVLVNSKDSGILNWLEFNTSES